MLTIRQSQMQAMAGASPGTQMMQPCACEATWIEFQLLDQDQNPVPGEKYRVRLPDSSLMEGALDENGKVRFDSIMPGQADITFPDMDRREWGAGVAGYASDSTSGASGGSTDTTSSSGSGDPTDTAVPGGDSPADG